MGYNGPAPTGRRPDPSPAPPKPAPFQPVTENRGFSIWHEDPNRQPVAKSSESGFISNLITFALGLSLFSNGDQ